MFRPDFFVPEYPYTWTNFEDNPIILNNPLQNNFTAINPLLKPKQ